MSATPTAERNRTQGETGITPKTRWFQLALLCTVILGALIRFSYIEHYPSFDHYPTVSEQVQVGGDGLSYHLEANRLAQGLGYTSALWDIGAETAHHPPAWVTLLGGFSAMGLDSIRQHQWVGAGVGLALIVIIALLARRLFGDITGLVAAVFAAVYPGFWVNEAQILAEPLALVLLGASLIAIYRFSEQTSLRRGLAVGFLLGLTALVRSEQLVLLVLVVPVILWRAKSLTLIQKAALGAIVVACVVLVLSPWAIFNAKRFDEPVLLSSNFGATLLYGNCSTTYAGKRLGFYDPGCLTGFKKPEGADRSTADRMHRDMAIENIRGNLDKLPVTILARYGRTLGLFRPAHTVEVVAAWQGTKAWPVWSWVIAFWFIVVLAAVGAMAAARTRAPILPLLVPVLVICGIVTVFYGEPRYHTLADLSLVILAARGAVELATWYRRRQTQRHAATPAPTAKNLTFDLVREGMPGV